MDDFEFETEFLTDEEVEEMLDSLALELAEQIQEDELGTKIVNPNRIKELACVYKTIKFLGEKNGAKVTYKLHQPYQSMGSVSIVGKNLEFTKGKLFVKAASMASNVNIYSKTDGTVKIDFTFHGLAVPID